MQHLSIAPVAAGAEKGMGRELLGGDFCLQCERVAWRSVKGKMIGADFLAGQIENGAEGHDKAKIRAAFDHIRDDDFILGHGD